jgi:hypothetical protein
MVVVFDDKVPNSEYLVDRLTVEQNHMMIGQQLLLVINDRALQCAIVNKIFTFID